MAIKLGDLLTIKPCSTCNGTGSTVVKLKSFSPVSVKCITCFGSGTQRIKHSEQQITTDDIRFDSTTVLRV